MEEKCIFLVLLWATYFFDGSFGEVENNNIPRGRSQFRRNYYQVSGRQRIGSSDRKISSETSQLCDCGTFQSEMKDLKLSLRKLQEKMSQMELAIDVLTRRQVSDYSMGSAVMDPAEEKAIRATTSTTTTTTTTTTTKEEVTYPQADCGGNGFYQVGHSCYTFTFYASLTYDQAKQFCKTSGGYLAVLNTKEERQWLRQHLNTHVASNIYPYETVTFFVGGSVDKETEAWIWQGFESDKDDLEDEKCENDHYVGDCIGLTWNQQMECRWFLTDTECNLKERFICERDPQ